MIWVLSHISFHGLRVLLELETQFPIIGSVASSSERLDFFTEMINMTCNTSYSKNIICAINNVIVMNDRVKKEFFRTIDTNKLISQYKISNKIDASCNDKNLINTMPFSYDEEFGFAAKFESEKRTHFAAKLFLPRYKRYNGIPA